MLFWCLKYPIYNTLQYVKTKLFKLSIQLINANKSTLKNDLMSAGLLEWSSVGLHGEESWFPSLFWQEELCLTGTRFTTKPHKLVESI